jgi:hypothetical protein
MVDRFNNLISLQIHKIPIREAKEVKCKMREKIIVCHCGDIAVVFKLWVLAAVN